jgi:hypothetical protein
VASSEALLAGQFFFRGSPLNCMLDGAARISQGHLSGKSLSGIGGSTKPFAAEQQLLSPIAIPLFQSE